MKKYLGLEGMMEPKRQSNKRIFAYTQKEFDLLDSLHQSQNYAHYGDGTYCAVHSWRWSEEWAKIFNLKNEMARKSKTTSNKCKICEETLFYDIREGLCSKCWEEEYGKLKERQRDSGMDGVKK